MTVSFKQDDGGDVASFSTIENGQMHSTYIHGQC